jgi:hypothetical protein
MSSEWTCLTDSFFFCRLLNGTSPYVWAGIGTGVAIALSVVGAAWLAFLSPHSLAFLTRFAPRSHVPRFKKHLWCSAHCAGVSSSQAPACLALLLRHRAFAQRTWSGAVPRVLFEPRNTRTHSRASCAKRVLSGAASSSAKPSQFTELSVPSSSTLV